MCTAPRPGAPHHHSLSLPPHHQRIAVSPLPIEEAVPVRFAVCVPCLLSSRLPPLHPPIHTHVVRVATLVSSPSPSCSVGLLSLRNGLPTTPRKIAGTVGCVLMPLHNLSLSSLRCSLLVFVFLVHFAHTYTHAFGKRGRGLLPFHINSRQLMCSVHHPHSKRQKQAT